jgi:predicted DNA-binding transcriptional regulator AlpA
MGQAIDGAVLRTRMGVLTQEELAEMMDVSVETLREWRRLKSGPDYIKAGKNVMYREADVQEWLKRNVVPVVRVTS